MSFILRQYQDEAVDAGLDFLLGKTKHNAIQVLPTGSGKSLIIANIAKKLDAPGLILQPSKEILEQNYAKIEAYGYSPSVFSASLGRKEISDITLATIDSAINNPDLFKRFKYTLIDECHEVNPKKGVYKQFLDQLRTKVLGFTATPYRLSVDGYGGPILKFITRTRPAIFKEVNYYVQNRTLFDQGYLAKLQYYNIEGFDRKKININTNGTNFDDQSVKDYIRQIDFPRKVIRVVNRLAEIRKNVLVFCAFIDEAQHVANNVPGAVIITGKTDKLVREQIIRDFKAGLIKVIVNVGVLTTGFDYPELETVVIARPTLSLSLYYQMIGRGLRPHEFKDFAMIVDMCGNIPLFGCVEDFWLDKEPNSKNGWYLRNSVKQLTNQYYGE